MGSSLTEPIRVLCVDDDPGLAPLVAEMIESEEPQIDATSVTDPTTVIDQIEERSIDCIVSDYDMPQMNGLELLESVRSSSPSIPFILFTAHGSEEIASEAISSGVSDYLQKKSGTEQYSLLANRVVNAVEKTRERRYRQRAEEWYYQLFEQRLIGVGLSQDGVYQLVNPFFAELLDYTTEEMIGKEVIETVAQSDIDRVKRALDKRENGDVDRVRYVVSLKTRGGSHQEVEVIGGTVTYEREPAVLGLIRPVDSWQSRSNNELATRLRSAQKSLTDVGQPNNSAVEAAKADINRVLQVLSESQEKKQDSAEKCDLELVANDVLSRLDLGASVDVEIETQDTVEIKRTIAYQVLEQLFRSTLSSHPEDSSVVLWATEESFYVEITSPSLDPDVKDPLISQDHSPPDPIAGNTWYESIDIYSTRTDTKTIKYEVAT